MTAKPETLCRLLAVLHQCAPSYPATNSPEDTAIANFLLLELDKVTDDAVQAFLGKHFPKHQPAQETYQALLALAKKPEAFADGHNYYAQLKLHFVELRRMLFLHFNHYCEIVEAGEAKHSAAKFHKKMAIAIANCHPLLAYLSESFTSQTLRQEVALQCVGADISSLDSLLAPSYGAITGQVEAPNFINFFMRKIIRQLLRTTEQPTVAQLTFLFNAWQAFKAASDAAEKGHVVARVLWMVVKTDMQKPLAQNESSAYFAVLTRLGRTSPPAACHFKLTDKVVALLTEPLKQDAEVMLNQQLSLWLISSFQQDAQLANQPPVRNKLVNLMDDFIEHESQNNALESFIELLCQKMLRADAEQKAAINKFIGMLMSLQSESSLNQHFKQGFMPKLAELHEAIVALSELDDFYDEVEEYCATTSSSSEDAGSDNASNTSDDFGLASTDEDWTILDGKLDTEVEHDPKLQKQQALLNVLRQWLHMPTPAAATFFGGLVVDKLKTFSLNTELTFCKALVEHYQQLSLGTEKEQAARDKVKKFLDAFLNLNNSTEENLLQKRCKHLFPETSKRGAGRSAMLYCSSRNWEMLTAEASFFIKQVIDSKVSFQALKKPIDLIAEMNLDYPLTRQRPETTPAATGPTRVRASRQHGRDSVAPRGLARLPGVGAGMRR